MNYHSSVDIRLLFYGAFGRLDLLDFDMFYIPMFAIVHSSMFVCVNVSCFGASLLPSFSYYVCILFCIRLSIFIQVFVEFFRTVYYCKNYDFIVCILEQYCKFFF